ncbi:unnamed protein product [Trichogramma brassicae]|uniref:Reverse transcriptase domain-containing protein n=1 Tax=Trichogramma brassicae TaxID=86971 RepID=A0A6H5IJW5_9HYME|nr:unnamed protein product [Trichogramma brassicae]
MFLSRDILVTTLVKSRVLIDEKGQRRSAGENINGLVQNAVKATDCSKTCAVNPALSRERENDEKSQREARCARGTTSRRQQRARGRSRADNRCERDGTLFVHVRARTVATTYDISVPCGVMRLLAPGGPNFDRSSSYLDLGVRLSIGVLSNDLVIGHKMKSDRKGHNPKRRSYSATRRFSSLQRLQQYCRVHTPPFHQSRSLCKAQTVHPPDARSTGLCIVSTLLFDHHLATVGDKSSRIAGALLGLIPHVGGPRSSQCYMSVLLTPLRCSDMKGCREDAKLRPSGSINPPTLHWPFSLMSARGSTRALRRPNSRKIFKPSPGVSLGVASKPTQGLTSCTACFTWVITSPITTSITGEHVPYTGQTSGLLHAQLGRIRIERTRSGLRPAAKLKKHKNTNQTSKSRKKNLKLENQEKGKSENPNTSIDVSHRPLENVEAVSRLLLTYDLGSRTKLRETEDMPKATCCEWWRYFTRTTPNFSFAHVTAADGLSAMARCTSFSTGPDGIPLTVLKLASPTLAEHIANLANRSFETGTFPSAWKFSSVVALSKYSTPSSPSDTWPISLLAELSKIVERLAHAQLSAHLSRDNLLDPQQHGFRPGHSTQTALLISKLRCLGCDALAVEWFSSYLSNRSMSVRRFTSFAELNSDANAVAAWAAKNKLHLNPTKTTVMILSSLTYVSSIDKAALPKITLNGTSIAYSSSIKCLDVTISSTLLWTKHINSLRRIFEVRFFAWCGRACARGGAGTTQKEDPGYVISLRSGKKTPITVRAGSDRITISRSPRRGLTKLAIDGAQHSHDEVRSENHTHKRAPDAGAKAQLERMMAPEARTTLTR